MLAATSLRELGRFMFLHRIATSWRCPGTVRHVVRQINDFNRENEPAIGRSRGRASSKYLETGFFGVRKYGGIAIRNQAKYLETKGKGGDVRRVLVVSRIQKNSGRRPT